MHINFTAVCTAVNLTSSAELDVCPGDTVVFTCVTDTGKLQWTNDNDDTKLYYSTSQVNQPAVTNDFGGIFVLKLIRASANSFESTATAYNVSLNNDGLNITCSGIVNNPNAHNSETNFISIGWTVLLILDKH